MRLSRYAKQMGVTYHTAFRWWKKGQLDGYQLETGTIIIREQGVQSVAQKIVLYARVSSNDQKEDLVRQLQRLRDFASARGYTIAQEVKEIASGLNDKRPKLQSLLKDPTIGKIVIEHKDRLTRFGFNYIEQLLETQGRKLEVIFPTDTDNELIDDFVAVITSMAARIYGKRNSKKHARKIKDYVSSLHTEKQA